MAQRPLIGCWLNTPNQWACEILASLGYGAVFLDGEHGSFNPESLDRLTALSKALGLQVYCRVATPIRPHIQQALDWGADALVLPQIRDLAHAREAAAFAKYPPLGSRGMGAPRSLNYGSTPDDFVTSENRRTKCFVMVETAGALAEVEAIAALPTVDGLFMGPYDLSLNRGRGQYAVTDEDRGDAERIAAAAAAAGKLVGVPAFSDADIEAAQRWDASVITINDDLSALAEGLGSAFRRISALLEKSGSA